MTRPTTPGGRPTEGSLVARAAQFLRDRGFRTYVNPDGTDYFDLVARRGGEIALVEAKVGQARELLGQALRRRPWGDWVAVVLPSRRMAEWLIRETSGRRSSRVGVWLVERDDLFELRAARLSGAGADGRAPFAPERERLCRILDRIDRGEIPAGVRWDGVAREVLRASGGRNFAEWRLDEPP